MTTSFSRTCSFLSGSIVAAALMIGNAGAIADSYYYPDGQGGYSWYGAPPSYPDTSSIYQQGSGTGETYPDGSGAYSNPNTGTGIITDPNGGVWVQPDPGGYSAPSNSD